MLGQSRKHHVTVELLEKVRLVLNEVQCRRSRGDGKLELGGGTVGTSWIMSSVGSALCLFQFCISLPHELNEMFRLVATPGVGTNH